MQDFVRTKSDEAAVDAGCYFDLAAAEHVRRFFEKFLRHSKGQFAGKKFELLDWQWDRVIAPLFGWRSPDGSRRFRRCGIAVPKKNGKSTLLAGLGLYLLCADREPGAEIYSAAADRAQASIIYNEAASMVDASRALAKRIKVRRASKILRYPRKNSCYQALSADVPTKDGLNIHGLLFDELHTQQTRALWNTLRYGGASRRQPLIIWITTAGTDRDSLGFEQWQQALAIQESRAVDISYHAVIYAAGEHDDWKDEATWRKANPSYGLTIDERDFREACDEAKASPVNENNFRRYRLNQWCAQETRWIGLDKWGECARPYTAADLAGKPCYVGLDLSTTTDLTAAAFLFREEGAYKVLPYFWLPQTALRTRERTNRTRLDAWAREGHIKLTPGDVVDYGIVRDDLRKLAEQFKVKQFCIDPWNATQIATDLAGDGFKVEYVRTGFASISAATKEFEKLVLGGLIAHNSHPVLTWMIGNIAVEQDASGNIKPTKKKSSEKIDGVVAAILALAVIIKALPKKSSRYEKGGLDSI
jgi:phage terminase large subunit-like protein